MQSICKWIKYITSNTNRNWIINSNIQSLGTGINSNFPSSSFQIELPFNFNVYLQHKHFCFARHWTAVIDLPAHFIRKSSGLSWSDKVSYTQHYRTEQMSIDSSCKIHANSKYKAVKPTHPEQASHASKFIPFIRIKPTNLHL